MRLINLPDLTGKLLTISQVAKDEFANVADGWLVAYAKTHGLILVTHEIYNPTVQRKVPMPNVCEEFDVRYVNTFEMLSNLKASFILASNF